MEKFTIERLTRSRTFPSKRIDLRLDEINRDISDSFAKEKLNETHYNLLNGKIVKIAADIKVKEDTT